MNVDSIASSFILVAAPGLAGIRILMWLLPGERRLPILLTGGLGVGIGLFLMVQMALLRFAPVQATAVGVHLLMLPPAILAVVSLARGGFTWGVPRGWAVAAAGLLSLITIGAIANFSAGVWTDASNENLTVRMAMAAHMARGDWPPMDPYAPEFERLYRYAAQAWVAALMRLSGAGLFEATLAVTIASVWATVGGIFATVGLLRNYLGRADGSRGLCHGGSFKLPRTLEGAVWRVHAFAGLRTFVARPGTCSRIHGKPRLCPATRQRFHARGGLGGWVWRRRAGDSRVPARVAEGRMCGRRSPQLRHHGGRL